MVWCPGKAGNNVADIHDSGGVFMYRDSSVSPVFDPRRKFKAVLDALDGAQVWGSVVYVGGAHCSMGSHPFGRSHLPRPFPPEMSEQMWKAANALLVTTFMILRDKVVMRSKDWSGSC